MTKIQDKLQMAYIDQNGKIHEKTFIDNTEANKVFAVLNKKHLPIATKKGMDSARIWNSNDIDWVAALIKTGRRFWQYSLGYELLSTIWEMTAFSLDINSFENDDEDHITTAAWKIPFNKNYLIVAEEFVTVSSDFPDTMMRDGQKYIEWVLYDGEERMVSFARPVLD